MEKVLTVVCLVLSVTMFQCLFCDSKSQKKLSQTDLLEMRLGHLQEDIVSLKAHKIIHMEFLDDLNELREIVSSLRRELRQKNDLLVEGLCLVGHEKGDIVTWTKTLKSKMNLI
jgi:hypothetical protein